MAVCCTLRLLFEDLVPTKRDTRSVQLQDLHDTNRNNDFSDFFPETFFQTCGAQSATSIHFYN